MRAWVMLVVVFFAGVLTIGGAIFTYVNVRQIAADSPIPLPAPPQFGNSGVPTVAPLIRPTAEVASASQIAPIAATGAATETADVALNGTQAANAIPALADPSRVTILVMGIDQRKGEKGPFRTDTMIVLSVDPIRKTAAILSIPRDIYITIPLWGKEDRINNANVIGDTLIKDFPGGGPALAVKTIESLIGVPIDRYMLINFDVFIAAVDAIGPLTVCPTTPIHDTAYPDGSYGFITVDFKAGCQDLDGVHLLQYARVRHNAGDDFGRAQRQQEVIRAVRDKVLSLGGVSSMLTKAASLWGSVKDDVKTDMTFEEMLQLAQVAQTIPKDSITSEVITDSGGYLLPATLPDGEQVLSPIYEKIHDLVTQMFDATAGGASTAQAGGNAVVLVSNGAGVDGLGKIVTDRLKGQGFNTLDPKNADDPGGYGKSVIRVYTTDKMDTARNLAQALGLDNSVIVIAKNGPPGVDIELVAGKDLVPATGKTGD